MTTQHQRGFSAVEVVIAVLVVAAVAGTGYLAYSRIQNNKSPAATEQTAEDTAQDAPTIDDASDLDRASQALDETDIDASTADSAELDGEVSSF